MRMAANRPSSRSVARQRFGTDAPWFGIFLVTASPMLAEACSMVGLDWVVIDMEAAPMTNVDTLHMLQAMSSASLLQLVRVSSLDRHLIEHALDLGAHGVVVPRVESREDAAEAADACRYPPLGHRGVNPIRASGYFTNLPDYLEGADARTLCAVQVESADGVEHVDEIANVPGVDVVFIGVGDLACSLGQPGVPDGPLMDAARRQILEATRAAGKVPGIFAYSEELARQYAEEGFELIAVGNEVKLLLSACIDTLSRVRAASGQ